MTKEQRDNYEAALERTRRVCDGIENLLIREYADVGDGEIMEGAVMAFQRRCGVRETRLLLKDILDF
uniref:Uncharacterized protein n=1 Tax=Candidatus Kentrum sp. LPFa TaxID=2126335 RepID=A0A450WMM9_9GAMM|nr:MAG: hypothetical protein BECKLPF1236B_GA0070989_113811 [Candidatus Kentron sp. LPFa]